MTAVRVVGGYWDSGMARGWAIVGGFQLTPIEHC